MSQQPQRVQPPVNKRVVAVGLDPRTLDYSKMSPEIDRETLIARVDAAGDAMREAGFDGVQCLVEPSPDAAEAVLRECLEKESFGLAMIGGGVRMMPEHTLLFERLVNVLTEVVPGIRFCFNTSPEDTLAAVRRWMDS
ncbi:hypothetical protein ACFQVC_06655 [Streptomyces monticola]|uniref:B12-binding domain-containing protein n=1 Tax=Streptomyces monticola TaxID=2666263 RepID=A0ABW2JD04_9ACTN